MVDSVQKPHSFVTAGSEIRARSEDLAISNNGAVRIDGARIVSGDIEASNGVIRIIDRVLLPARI